VKPVTSRRFLLSLISRWPERTSRASNADSVSSAPGSVMKSESPISTSAPKASTVRELREALDPERTADPGQRGKPGERLERLTAGHADGAAHRAQAGEATEGPPLKTLDEEGARDLGDPGQAVDLVRVVDLEVSFMDELGASTRQRGAAGVGDDVQAGVAASRAQGDGQQRAGPVDDAHVLSP
jgi:hypothetical protein